jgi:hypothetical protein
LIRLQWLFGFRCQVSGVWFQLISFLLLTPET